MKLRSLRKMHFCRQDSLRPGIFPLRNVNSTFTFSDLCYYTVLMNNLQNSFQQDPHSFAEFSLRNSRRTKGIAQEPIACFTRPLYPKNTPFTGINLLTSFFLSFIMLTSHLLKSSNRTNRLRKQMYFFNELQILPVIKYYHAVRSSIPLFPSKTPDNVLGYWRKLVLI